MYNSIQMLLFEVCTLNSQKMYSFNSYIFKVLKFTTLIYKYCWKSGKKKRFVKKIKNPNALDTYLSRKEKKNSKSTLFKITPRVTKKLAFPYIQSYISINLEIWMQNVSTRTSQFNFKFDFHRFNSCTKCIILIREKGERLRNI